MRTPQFYHPEYLDERDQIYPEGGEISVAYVNRNQGDICIKDTGLGMTPKIISNLFTDRIYSHPATEGEPGTGIGLIFCRK